MAKRDDSWLDDWASGKSSSSSSSEGSSSGRDDWLKDWASPTSSDIKKADALSKSAYDSYKQYQSAYAKLKRSGETDNRAFYYVGHLKQQAQAKADEAAKQLRYVKSSISDNSYKSYVNMLSGIQNSFGNLSDLKEKNDFYASHPANAAQDRMLEKSAYAMSFAPNVLPSAHKTDPFSQYGEWIDKSANSNENIIRLTERGDKLAELAQGESDRGNMQASSFYKSLSDFSNYSASQKYAIKNMGEEMYQKYESDLSVSYSEDFGNYAKYFPFAPDGNTVDTPDGKMQSWKDPDRLLHEAVNGNENALAIIKAGAQNALNIKEQDSVAFLNDSERAVYNYLYVKKGARAAREFVENIGEELKRRKMESALQGVSDFAREHKTWASALSVATGPLKVISSIGQLGDYVINGEVDPNASYNFYSRSVNTAREVASEDMGGVGKFLYNTGMSMGDSYMSQLLGQGEVGSLIIMGGEAAADAVLEGKQRGLSDDQAFWLGQAKGMVEVLTEKIGLERLYELRGSKKASKELIYGVLKQVGAEATEEGIANLADLMLDTAVALDKSEIAIRTAELKEEHPEYSSGRIFSTIFWEKFCELNLDSLGGALSGGVMGGFATVGNTVRTTRSIKTTANDAITKGYVSSYVQYAQNNGLKTFGVEKQGDGTYKNTSVYNLVQAVSSDIANHIQGRSLDNANTIYNALKSQYGDGVAKLATEVYYDSVKNDIETMKAVDGSIQGLRESFEAQTRNADTMTPMAEAFRSAYAQEARARNRETESEAESSNAKQIMVDSAVQNIAARRSGAKMAEVTVKTENGRAETAQIEKMNKDGQLVLSNGQTVSVNDADVSDSVIEIQSLAKTYDLSSADTAQLFNLTLDHAKSFPSENVYDYFSQLVHAYEQGQGGKYTQQQAAKSFSVKGLLPVDHDLAYSLGRSRFDEASRQRAERIAQLKETAKKNGITERRGTVDKSALADKNGRIKMNSDRAFAIRLSTTIAETLGVDVKLVEGDSKVEGDYGDGTITLNVDQMHKRPGETVQGAIVRVLSHEVTHSFEKTSETYKELRQFCYDYAAQQIGVDAVEARVRAIQKLYNEAGLDYNRQDAEAEFVAQSCEQMLQNSDMLVELYKRSTTLYQRFVDAINELFAKLKKIVSAVNENAKLMQGGMDQLQKLWDKCYAEASETIKNTALEKSGEVEYSVAIPDGTVAATEEEAKKLPLADHRNVLRFQNAVTEVLYGTMESGKTVFAGMPTELLAKYLKSDKGLYIPQSAIRKMTFGKDVKGGKHGFGRVVADELLYQLADPMAITGNTTQHVEAGDNSIVVWTNWMTKAGDSIIVPIRIDADGAFNNINTAFDVYNEQYVEDLLRDGNILYTKENRNIQELLSSGRQVPEAKQSDVSTDSIRNPSEKSNPSAEKNSPQFSIASDADYLSLAEKFRDGTATEAETEQLRQAVEQAARKAMPNTKILDEDGNLLTVYHGTSEQFTKFDMSKGRTNMDINGSFFSPWELDAQGYGENVRKFYLNITNPANESTGYKALHRFQGQNKAGVKAREYLESLGYDGVNNEDEEFIAFRSEQIKSADLVTYDDNGEIIPLSERFKSDNNDIRYSIALDDSSYLSIAEKYRDGTATEEETEQLRQAVEQAAKKAGYKQVDFDYDKLSYDLFSGRNSIDQDRIGELTRRANDMRSKGWIGRPVLAYDAGDTIQAITGSHRLEVAKIANADVNAVLLTEQELSDISSYLDESDSYYDLDDFLNSMDEENQADILENAYLSGYESLLEPYVLLRIEAESNFSDSKNQLNENPFVKQTEKWLDVKSADLVTYDDNGEIIPLSERFKSDNNDIRYSIAFDDSISDEDLLWQLRLEDAQTNGERNWLEDAQGKANKLNSLREQLKAAQKQIRAWEQKGKRSGTYSQQLIDSKNRDIRNLEKQIAKYEKILAGELRNPQLSRLLNEARTKAEAAMKAKKDQQMADYKESRRMTETRHKIKALKDVIDRRLTKPTVKQYVPQELLRATVDILEQIDTTYRQGAKSENAQTRLQALHSTYEKIKAEYPTAYSPIVAQMISELAGTVQGKTIYQLSSDELNDVHTALKAIYTTINNSITANEIEKGKYQWEIGADMIREIQSGDKNRFRLPQGFANMMTDAQRMFRRLGQYRENSAWNKVLKMLNNAQHDKATILYESNRIFDPVLRGMNGKKTLIQAAQDLMSTANSDLVDVGFVDRNGNKVKLTRDMMLSLYMHSLNEQNTLHMLYGITLPGLDAYYSGKEGRYDAKNGGKRIYYGSYSSIEELNQIAKELKNADPDKAAALESRRNEIERDMLSRFGEMQNKIAEQLTDYEKSFIKCAQEFFRYASDRINETTLKMYGFEKATVKNYFPIMTDSAFTKADMQTIVSDISIESWGNLKNRIEGARNPMYLNGFLDTISRHMDKMSTFAATALPMNTFNGIWKTQFANYDTSMEDAFRNSVYGQRTYNWIENLYADLTGNRKSSGSKLLEKARGNIAPAALMFNVSVMAKQAASYPTAIATVGWAPAMKALVKGGRNGMMISRANTELINTYTPLLWLRSQGMIDPEINDAKNRQSGFAKAMQAIPGLKQFYNFGVNGIQAVDMATVGRLWSAAEYYVDKNFPTLKKGTEAQIKAGESEYYQKVAEIFNKITEETQPDYTVLQRPDILRNKDSLVRSLTMFMTQRLQNFQIGYYAIDELQTVKKQYNENKTAENKARLQEAKKNAFNGISALLTSTIVIGVMTGVGKFLLHKPWRDDDDEVTVESTVDGVFWSCIESMAGNVVGGTEAYNLLRSIFGGDTYYGIEAQNISVISDLMDNIVSTTNWLRQNGLDASAEEWQKFLTKGAGSKLINSAAQLFGVPAGQIRNLIRGIYQHAMDGVGMQQSKYDRWWMTGYDYDNAKLLVEYVQDGNETAAEYRYNEIMDKALNSGKTAEEAQEYAAQSIRNQTKEMFLSGDIGYDDAMKILTGEYVGKDEDDAYWLLDEWQNKKDSDSSDDDYSRYDELHDSIDNNVPASQAFKYLTDGGYTDDQIKGEAKKYIASEYKEGKITAKQLSGRLAQYCGITKTEEIEEIQYNADWKNAYPDYQIDESQAYKYYKKLKGVVSADAWYKYLTQSKDFHGDGKKSRQVDLIYQVCGYNRSKALAMYDAIFPNDSEDTRYKWTKNW